MTIEQWLGADNQLGIDIWKKKYQRGNESFDEWVNRVSGGDPDTAKLILERKFLFGGRILSNRGVTGEKVTYSNCYVIAPPEDNIANVLSDLLKELAAENGEDMREPELQAIKNGTKHTDEPVNKCPVCGAELVAEGGCNICKACGYDKCDQ